MSVNYMLISIIILAVAIAIPFFALSNKMNEKYDVF